ncbi:hypothetical protein BHM03_00056425 [Ensete ventricosum]|nr:hypothetical protein BHM03_00056425 [Ensete ventricosum]
MASTGPLLTPPAARLPSLSYLRPLPPRRVRLPPTHLPVGSSWVSNKLAVRVLHAQQQLLLFAFGVVKKEGVVVNRRRRWQKRRWEPPTESKCNVDLKLSTKGGKVGVDEEQLRAKSKRKDEGRVANSISRIRLTRLGGRSMETAEGQIRGILTHGGRYVRYNVYGNLFEVTAKYVPPLRPLGRGAYGIVW